MIEREMYLDAFYFSKENLTVEFVSIQTIRKTSD